MSEAIKSYELAGNSLIFIFLTSMIERVSNISSVTGLIIAVLNWFETEFEDQH